MLPVLPGMERTPECNEGNVLVSSRLKVPRTLLEADSGSPAPALLEPATAEINFTDSLDAKSHHKCFLN